MARLIGFVFLILFVAVPGLAQVRLKVLVVSDVDDTLKESYVLNRVEVVKRATRTEPAMAFPGIAKAFRAIDRDLRDRGHEVRYAYVSSAPAQIMTRFHAEFLQRSRFPQGTLDLRPLWDSEDYKVSTIRSIIGFHRPDFVLMIGDHSEKDPRVYSRIGEELRSARIPFLTFIRQVYGPEENPASFEAGQYAFVSTAEFALGLYDAGILAASSLRDELVQYVTPGAAYVRCRGHRARPGRSSVDLPDLAAFVARRTAEVCR